MEILVEIDNVKASLTNGWLRRKHWRVKSELGEWEFSAEGDEAVKEAEGIVRRGIRDQISCIKRWFACGQALYWQSRSDYGGFPMYDWCGGYAFTIALSGKDKFAVACPRLAVVEELCRPAGGLWGLASVTRPIIARILNDRLRFLECSISVDVFVSCGQDRFRQKGD